MKTILNKIRKWRPVRIMRVAHHRTEIHIKIGLPIFIMICIMALSLLYKLTTVTHVHFGY